MYLLLTFYILRES